MPIDRSWGILGLHLGCRVSGSCLFQQAPRPRCKLMIALHLHSLSKLAFGRRRRTRVFEHFQPNVATVFSPPVRAGCSGAQGRAQCPRVHLLGPVRGHAVLAIRAGRSCCARSVAAWPPAKASCGIWACRTRPRAPPWLMPTSIVHGSCTAASSTICSAAAVVTEDRVHESRNRPRCASSQEPSWSSTAVIVN